MRLSAVTARLVTLSACPAWRTTSGRGGGSFLAKLPLQRFSRGGTRPIARNPWSPSLESCCICFRQDGRFRIDSGLPSPASKAEVNGPDRVQDVAGRPGAIGREPRGDPRPSRQPAEPFLARRDAACGDRAPWPAGRERAARPTAVASQQTTWILRRAHWSTARSIDQPVAGQVGPDRIDRQEIVIDSGLGPRGRRWS